MTQAALDARDLALAYGGRRVLDGVSLEVRPGRVTALLGPNGAGKTSLMRVLAGCLKPAAGAVRVLGRDPFASAAVRARLGWVPQDLALYPRLTARENAEVFARLAGVPRGLVAGRAAAALALTGAAEVADTTVERLSGGFQRRVNIAAALGAEPAVLLLDEPSNGVDRAARSAVHDALDGLRRAGTAILVATHDLAEAERLADDVAVLHRGRIAASGALPDILAERRRGPPEHEAILDAAASPAAEAVLAAAGFVQAGALDWRAARTQRDGGALFLHLRAEGVPVREVRIHAPGLDAFYLSAVGPVAEDGR